MSDVELTVTVEELGKLRAQMRDRGEKNERDTRFEGEIDKLHLDTIHIFENMLSEARIKRREELEVLGKHLYRIIFNKGVEDFFQQALEKVTDRKRLRVQLSFEEKAADVGSLRWEYLYYPKSERRRGFFLATHVDLVLSRYMPLETSSLNLAPVESSLRILIVISNPEDERLGPVGAEPIIEAMGKLGERYSIEFERLEKPTVDNFIDKLRTVKPHVLHFFGHVRYDMKEEEAKIALLEIDEKSVIRLTDKEFTDCFIRARLVPRLVFLHLCESSTIDFNANFDRLAPELIRANIPAVVAMKYPITTKDATVFCRTFYDELAKGEPVDAAVQEGRYRIKSHLFGTPVLYLQSSDSIVQPTASIASKGSRGAGSAIAPSKQEEEPIRVSTIVQVGQKPIEKITKPSADKLKMYQILSELREQLLAKNKLEEMRVTLSSKYFEVDPEFQSFILAMIEAVRKMLNE